jgi:molybdate transport system substrate-binding protein
LRQQLQPGSTSGIYLKSKVFPQLVNVPGIDFAGRLPDGLQLVQVFAAAIVTGAKEPEAGRLLIRFLASDRAAAAIEKSGMDLIR